MPDRSLHPTADPALHRMPPLPSLRWPLPALLAWAAAWAAWAVMQGWAVPGPLALLFAAAIPAALSLRVAGRWRQCLVGAGFPLSALLLGAGQALPAWAWLLPLALLLLIYPLQAWRDAPVFPTGEQALVGLDGVIELPRNAHILDAGSGLGHALQALHALWPQAHLLGLERSLPLALLSQQRCRYATIRRADMWAGSWAGFDLVYLFQRPESMARAWDKARAEMAPHAWLVSLEFEVPGQQAVAVLQGPARRPVHVYRLSDSHPPVPAQPRPPAADKSPRPAQARAAG